MQWMYRFFCSWFINEWWGSSIHFISSLQEYNILFFAHTDIAWAWHNMSFMHKYGKFQERNSYKTENSCSKIMQNFGISFRILYSRNWKTGFSFSTFLNPWKNNCVGKRHGVFVSQHNKFDWKYTSGYAEIFQVLSEQVCSQ